MAQKYVNAMLGQNLVLIDSIQFMNSASLQNWFKTCEKKNLTICHYNFEENNYSQLKKRIYPQEHMNSF